MKKVLSLLLSLLMLFSITAGIDFSAYALASSGKCGYSATWSFDKSTGTLTISGTGDMYDYDYDWRESPFYESSIKSAVIENGITSIGDEAFARCSRLTSVTIPNSVTSIGDRAFADCTRLTSVTIPDSVTSIGDYAFYYCTSLTSVTIPDSVTSIGDSAFYYCTSLTSVSIPDSVTKIGYSAFGTCRSLTSVTISNGVTSIGDYAFYYCTSLTSITIPNSVTSIGEDAFYYCTSLTSVTISNGVTSIGDRAFADCTSLTSVSIPDSVTKIGYSAFGSCRSLTSVTIPNSVTSIGIGAFYLVNNIVYNGTASGSPWGAKAVNGYVDGYLVYKDSTKKELLGCFVQATNVIIPNSVTNIGGFAFYYCTSLTSVTIPDSVTSIGNYAFEDCTSLTSVTIPDSVTSIGDSAFSWCSSLTSVTIPNSVTSISDSAFYYCKSLTSIAIPNSVTSIGDSAFYWCSSLTDVYYAGTKEQWNSISIGYSNECLTNATIHYNHYEHIYSDVITPPSCTAQGYTTLTCTKCDYSYQTDYTDALGHDMVKVSDAVNPTCFSVGWTAGYKCSRCDYEVRQEQIKMLAHKTKTTTTKATTTKDGKIVKTCTVCKKTLLTTAIPMVKTVTISATNYNYDGKVKTPSVTVKDSKGKTLKRNTDYTVSYSSGRKYVGKYAVKITLKGNYAGTKTMYFNINPKGTSIVKVTPKSRAFTVSWKKQTNQTTGYQIQYSVYSNFKSVKTITMPKNTYYAKSITGLSGNKRYYVRIRTYKTVKFNGKNYNLYSPWSSTKYTTTKR